VGTERRAFCLTMEYIFLSQNILTLNSRMEKLNFFYFILSISTEKLNFNSFIVIFEETGKKVGCFLETKILPKEAPQVFVVVEVEGWGGRDGWMEIFSVDVKKRKGMQRMSGNFQKGHCHMFNRLNNVLKMIERHNLNVNLFRQH